MAGLVGYGGDPAVVASRAEIDRIGAHLHLVGSQLVLHSLNFLPDPIARLQLDSQLPLLECRVQKTRLALSVAAENYFTTEARVSHTLEAVGHALQKHPWLLHLIPKPVLREIEVAGLSAFAVAQLAPGNFGKQATGALASTVNLESELAKANRRGLLVDRPVQFRQIASRSSAPVGSVTEIGRRIEEVNRFKRQIRIDTYVGGDGQKTMLVYLPGTQSLLPIAGSNPFDVTTDATLAANPDQSQLLKAISGALDSAGAKGAHVIFAGYSLGGIAAAELAASGRFDVTGVITIGSPIGQVNLPSGIPVLSIENSNDPVPAATGRVNPLTENWATVSAEAKLHLGVPAIEAHELENYFGTLQEVDQTKMLGASRVRDLIVGQLKGSELTETQTYEFNR